MPSEKEKQTANLRMHVGVMEGLFNFKRFVGLI
jgi:hypothetical protein